MSSIDSNTKQNGNDKVSKKIIIADIQSSNIEGNCEGHYFSVAKNFYDVLKDRYDVYITGGPIYRTKFAAEKLIDLPYDNRHKNVVVDFVHEICNSKSLYSKLDNSDIILFQCSATTATLLSLLLFAPANKIILIQYDKMICESYLKRTLFSLVRKKVSGIICPDSEIGESLKETYCVLPDYIYVPPKIHFIREKTFDIGIYGILAAGKGIEEAVNFLVNTSYRVRIAGKIGNLPEDQEMYEHLLTIMHENSNISLDSRYLSDEEYKEYIRSSRYILLNYSESYALRSSGVLLDAIYNNTPVIVKKKKLASFVEMNSLGYVYDDIKSVDFELLLRTETIDFYQRKIKDYINQTNREIYTLYDFIKSID